MIPLIKPFFFGFLLALFPLAINPERVTPQGILLIESFDHEELPSQIGTWDHNILDSNQSVRIELVRDDARGKAGGKSLAIHFDVDSPNPAMVGVWIELKDRDLSAFDTLHFSLKSVDENRFRGSVAVQFTDEGNRKASYLVSGIRKDWKEYGISLKKFPRINDWSKVKEFEVVIDDMNAVPKEGTLLIDEIYVSGEVA